MVIYLRKRTANGAVVFMMEILRKVREYECPYAPVSGAAYKVWFEKESVAYIKEHSYA